MVSIHYMPSYQAGPRPRPLRPRPKSPHYIKLYPFIKKARYKINNKIKTQNFLINHFFKVIVHFLDAILVILQILL